VSAERDAERKARFDRLEQQLAEMKALLDEELASFLKRGELLAQLLKAERLAREELIRLQYIVPPAHD
jgi:hypothetical protein